MHINPCAALAAAVLTITSATVVPADIRIYNDRGGRIDHYLYRFEQVRNSGERVIIDGYCASACTLVLGSVAADRICVTANANLAFHAAWVFDPSGARVTSPRDTGVLWAHYPLSIRAWIQRHGGLTATLIYLRGRELAAMYRPCSGPAAQQTASPGHSTIRPAPGRAAAVLAREPTAAGSANNVAPSGRARH